jgi:hypothetical protein
MGDRRTKVLRGGSFTTGTAFFAAALEMVFFRGATFFGEAFFAADFFVVAFFTVAFFTVAFFGTTFFFATFLVAAFFAATFFVAAFFAGACVRFFALAMRGPVGTRETGMTVRATGP